MVTRVYHATMLTSATKDSQHTSQCAVCFHRTVVFCVHISHISPALRERILDPPTAPWTHPACCWAVGTVSDPQDDGGHPNPRSYPLSLDPLPPIWPTNSRFPPASLSLRWAASPGRKKVRESHCETRSTTKEALWKKNVKKTKNHQPRTIAKNQSMFFFQGCFNQTY